MVSQTSPFVKGLFCFLRLYSKKNLLKTKARAGFFLFFGFSFFGIRGALLRVRAAQYNLRNSAATRCATISANCRTVTSFGSSFPPFCAFILSANAYNIVVYTLSCCKSSRTRSMSFLWKSSTAKVFRALCGDTFSFSDNRFAARFTVFHTHCREICFSGLRVDEKIQSFPQNLLPFNRFVSFSLNFAEALFPVFFAVYFITPLSSMFSRFNSSTSEIRIPV